MIKNYKTFLDEWFKNIETTGIDVSGMILDHLGYSAGSTEEYEELKKEFLLIGNLEREAIVSNRRVGIFRLTNPFVYKKHSISAIELIEPKQEETDTLSGYEHAEFTTPTPLTEIVNKYPNINWDTSSISRSEFARLKLVFPDKKEVKFNNQPILS